MLQHRRKAFNRRILHLGFLHLPLVFINCPIRCCRLLKFQGESFFKLWMSAVDAFLPSISIAILSRHQKKNLQITSYSFFYGVRSRILSFLNDHSTPPWPNPPIKRLVHVGQEANCLPHRLLLLWSVHLVNNRGKIVHPHDLQGWREIR